MAPPTTPIRIPTTLVAGDSATWDDPSFVHPTLGQFDAAGGWTLTYYLVSSGSNLAKPATTQGSGWRTTLTPADTLPLKDAQNDEAELVRWSAAVTQGSDKYTVGDGTLILHPNPQNQTAGYKSHNRQMLDDCNAAVRTRIQDDIVAYQINGRTVTREQVIDLRKMRAFYAAAVWREEHPGQLGPQVVGRFTGGA